MYMEDFQDTNCKYYKMRKPITIIIHLMYNLCNSINKTSAENEYIVIQSNVFLKFLKI